jgi:hypothetical protein
MALGWIIATLSGIAGVLLTALGGYAAISGLGLLVYGGLGGLGLASFGYVISECLRSVRAKTTGEGLGCFLAIGSGLIGLVVMSGIYGYVFAITCLPPCLVGLGAVVLERWHSKVL